MTVRGRGTGGRCQELALAAALDPCLAVRRLRARVPFGDLLPLVDVRRRVIVRRPVSGVYLDWDGVPRWR